MNKTNNIPTLRFPEFKDNWEMKKLGEVAELTSSKRVYANDYVSMGIPFYRGKEITELKENKSPSDILYISENAYKNFKKTSGVPQINDLLITAVGTLGNILTIRNNNPFYFKDGNLIWLRKVNQISSFLEIVLYFNFKEIEKSAIGSSQKALTMIELRKLSLSFPTLAEQTKIANFLTAVDEKIQALKKKKSLLENYKKGLMQKLFSQTLRFKDEHGNDFANWEVKKLGEVCEITIGEFVIKTKQNPNGKYPVYNGGITPTGFYDDFNNEGNKIIISARGANAGFVNFQKEKYWAGNSCYSIDVLNKSNFRILFFYYFIKMFQNRFVENQQAANIPSVSKKDAELFEINLPSLAEQTKIANFLSSIDSKIGHCQTSIVNYERWKKGLLQRLFV